MFSNLLKRLSILKKFLFINFVFFTIIGLFTFAYLKNVQPNLIKKKSINHIEVINNTIDNLIRIDVKFKEEDIRRFLFSTRFLFQNLDRVLFFDNESLKRFDKILLEKKASLPPLRIAQFLDFKHKEATSAVTFGLLS